MLVDMCPRYLLIAEPKATTILHTPDAPNSITILHTLKIITQSSILEKLPSKRRKTPNKGLIFPTA